MRQREVVVVTGASAGVGRATAVEFARQGAAGIALLARGEDGLEGARREVERLGAEALALPLDVVDHEAVERAAATAEERLGPIDVWVNNAMATIFARFLDVTPEEFRRATEVTYLGYVWGTRAALRRMAPRNRGTIVQVGSALAYRGIPLQSPYCGAKHAIQGFTEALRCELLHDRVDVHLTMVQLPALNTPQFEWGRTRMPSQPQPVPPIYQPEVAARGVVWAARQRRREVNVGLPTRVTITGDKLAPGLGDLYLGRSGISSQQTSQPVDPDRPDNLFEPVPGDHGARGRFGERARAADRYFWLTTHRDAIVAAAGGALSALGLRGLRRR
ncbi:MAG: SDR family oxidoreductase [Thermoleophilia bacterium]|nr:SDR family oxidoreductase [Thermoleophilia bacterium]